MAECDRCTRLERGVRILYAFVMEIRRQNPERSVGTAACDAAMAAACEAMTKPQAQAEAR